ncbi:Uma2 family endonuclease [Nonomuraea rhodomycinica]|uniref:Uma2 family endonuclease n=1 Tax=Nonomuraea rhodomycinica TaxID=1712872 RepID=A0A7Y6IMN6_9ACTN|nr:Uma2 family endonuclease [Nonomuraea rhodomycinica]
MVRRAALTLATRTFVPEDVHLVVEVTSEPSIDRDRTTKPAKYAQAGIKHFWRVEEEGPLRAPVVHGGHDAFHARAVVVQRPDRLGLGGRGQAALQQHRQRQPAQQLPGRDPVRAAHRRHVDPQRVLVARRHVRPVGLHRDEAEAVGQVAGAAADRAAAKPAAALAAGQPVVGGVHDAPLVPVGLVDDHLGDRPLLLRPRPRELPLQERPPALLDDLVHQPRAAGAAGRTGGLPVRALLALPHAVTVSGVPTVVIRLSAPPPPAGAPRGPEGAERAGRRSACPRDVRPGWSP